MMIPLIQRMYNDFIPHSRLSEYRNLLDAVLQNDYETHSVLSFLNIIKSNTFDSKKKYFISRHDVDSGVKTAYKMFQIEKDLGVRASYYFRLNTLDYDFMQNITSYGSEASYHFEELATYCKEHNIKTKEDAFREIKSIQKIFINNFFTVKQNSGIDMVTVAAHGDFYNRYLGIGNSILVDKEVRNITGILLETYDEDYMRYISARSSDAPLPIKYKPCDPFEYIKQGQKVIYLLTHPMKWLTRPFEILSNDFKRTIDYIKYNA